MAGFEQHAQAQIGDNILAQIAGTARDIIAAAEDIEKAEAVLKKAQQKLKDLKEVTMVELMKDAGQTELTTADGYIVSIKDKTRGQPTKENERAAFDWLREHKQGGVIKTKIEADLGKADPKVIDKAVAALAKLKIVAGAKSSVHHQTLGALVRELLGRGESIPLDILGVHIWTEAEVKPKK